MLNSCMNTLIDTRIEPRYPYNIGIGSMETGSLSPWLVHSLGFGWNRHNNLALHIHHTLPIFYGVSCGYKRMKKKKKMM